MEHRDIKSGKSSSERLPPIGAGKGSPAAKLEKPVQTEEWN
jgi:hypothetical protein